MKRSATENKQDCARTNRMFKKGANWFFKTREGSAVGPFRDELEVSTQLEVYIRLVASGLLPQEEPETAELVARKRAG
jgi:hypothetical protein